MHGEKNLIDPELVAAVTSMGQHAKFHPTVSSPGESLPTGFTRSSTCFLLCTTVPSVQVDHCGILRWREAIARGITTVDWETEDDGKGRSRAGP